MGRRLAPVSPRILANSGITALSARVPITGKAAIYTRVSTDKQQDGASLGVQLEACRDYCKSRGLVVVEEFKDVLSGLKVDRPAYREAVALAKSKGVDKLVVWRLDRLGRDEAEYMTQLRDLRRLGVDVVSVTQPGESVLLQNMLVVLAGEESRQLSIRITASKRRRSSEGKWGSSTPPFGYDLLKHPDGGSVLVPSDDARLVRAMFQRYAKGKTTLRGIRNYLREHGHTTSVQAVLNRLRNPVYLGVIRHGKYARSRFGPNAGVVESKGQHSALVDQATFDRVQALLSANKSRRNGGPTAKYLFTGLVHCGECSHRYVAHPVGREGRYVSYYCSRKVDVGDCSAGSVAESRLREAVLTPIERLLRKLKRSDLRKMVKDEVLIQLASLEATSQAQRAELELRQRQLEARLSKLEDAYLDEAISRDRYLSRRNGVLAEIDEVKAMLQAKPAALPPDMERFFAAVDSLNGQRPDDGEWREIITEMVDRVVVGKRLSVVWREAYRPLRALGEGVR